MNPDAPMPDAPYNPPRNLMDAFTAATDAYTAAVDASNRALIRAHGTGQGSREHAAFTAAYAVTQLRFREMETARKNVLNWLDAN